MKKICLVCEARLAQRDFSEVECEISDCSLCRGVFSRESELLENFRSYEEISDVCISVKLAFVAEEISDVRIFSVKDALKTRLRRKLPAFATPSSPLLPSVHLEISAASSGEVSVRVVRESVFVVGKYRKTSRKISQSKWFAASEVQPETSIEELLVAAISRAMKTEIKNFRFSASGREDLDVRMLGDGRTFCLEIPDLRNFRGLLSHGLDGRLAFPLTCVLADEVADKFAFTNFRLADKPFVKFLATAAETHKKLYACVIHSKTPLPADLDATALPADVEIAQLTPIRTLQRRANAVRKKVLHEISLSRLNDHFAFARLTTSAGMYIKEFVHGDLGRTRPSLPELLGLDGPMDILQLDVLGVQEDEAAAYPGHFSL